MKSKIEPIYLDYHATTPCDPAVTEAMLPYFGTAFGNPSSTTHYFGRQAAKAVETARQQVADLIGALPGEIVFTSGATEGNNLATKGLAEGVVSKTGRRKIVTTALEHKAILDPCKRLAKQGFEVVYLPVQATGRVDLEAAKSLIDEATLLVTVHAANNEIGTLQPLAELAELAHENGALLHTDAAQAVGKVSVDVAAWDIDLLSLSGHKYYGPKGIGALFVRGGARALPLRPLSLGGGQEQELRPGTLNVPGIVGLGAASKLARDLLEGEAARVGALRDTLEKQLTRKIPSLRINGDKANRLPNNSSLTFPGVDAEALIVGCPELALSTGSACTSGAIEPSHVLQAIGVSRADGFSTVRVGLGRFTTEDNILAAVQMLASAHERLSTIGVP